MQTNYIEKLKAIKEYKRVIDFFKDTWTQSEEDIEEIIIGEIMYAFTEDCDATLSIGSYNMLKSGNLKFTIELSRKEKKKGKRPKHIIVNIPLMRIALNTLRVERHYTEENSFEGKRKNWFKKQGGR